jgi:hypothetical protein
MGGTPSTGFGKVPILIGVLPCPNAPFLSPSTSVDADAGGVLIPTPVGSSIPFPSSSQAPTSLTNTPKICCGRSFAMLAYSSRSCSPVSPMRIKRESRKLSRTSTIPERLRVAGAERRPLKRERPAYDFRRTEPGCMVVSLLIVYLRRECCVHLVVISRLRRIH